MRNDFVRMEQRRRTTSAAAPASAGGVEGTGAGAAGGRAAAAASAGTSRRCTLCDAIAVFGFDGEHLPSLCEGHQLVDHVQALAKPCFEKGCPNRVSHVWEREGDDLCSCAAHAVKGMIQTRGVPCESPDCQSRPSCAPEGEKQGDRGRAHADPGLVRVVQGAAGCTEEKGDEGNDRQEQPRPARDRVRDRTTVAPEGIISARPRSKRQSPMPAGNGVQPPGNFPGNLHDG
ncbi:unnamed protein product, partial [Scytosiphon promiscuus]